MPCDTKNNSSDNNIITVIIIVFVYPSPTAYMDLALAIYKESATHTQWMWDEGFAVD